MGHPFIHEITTGVGQPAGGKADALALFLTRDGAPVDPPLLDIGGAPLRFALGAKDFARDPGEVLVVYGASEAFPRVILVGLGGPEGHNRERLRAAGGALSRRARDLRLSSVVAQLPAVAQSLVPLSEQAELLVEGALLGAYQYSAQKTQDLERYRTLERLMISASGDISEAALAAAAQRGQIRAEAVNLARELAATPANLMTPTILAQRAAAMAEERGLACQVFDREACAEMGMGAFLSVAQGSDQPPAFITLRYSCGRPGAPLIGLIGKGLTFDAGGISLKPPLNMHEMKYDMCGAAAVIGAMSALPLLRPGVDVVAAIPSTENLPSGRATKPGDVFRSLQGKTIEVLNTDAEGRLVLADALTWMAREHRPAAIVDLATLTGAVVIALSHYGAAVLANDDALAERLRVASERSGDLSWRLPLWEAYPEHMKSETADLKNIADPTAGGGTIAGGVFLREFVEGIAWAHVDIAATAWWDKDRPHLPKGPSGYGVRLLLDLLEGYQA